MSNLAEFPQPDPNNQALGVLFTEVLQPILDRMNQALDELENAVARIAEAPHGRDLPGQMGTSENLTVVRRPRCGICKLAYTPSPDPYDDPTLCVPCLKKAQRIWGGQPA